MENRKKILIMIYSLQPGGAERQVQTDTNILLKLGYHVTIAYLKEGPLKTQFSDKVSFFRIKIKNEIRASIQLYRYLRSNKFKCIFAHMYWSHKVAALPSFFTSHKVYFFEHGLGLWRKWHHLLIIKFITNFAIKVVTVSEAKRYIKINRENIRADKVVNIPNSFKSIIRNNKQESISGMKNDLFLIGFAGRFNPVKQLHLVIDFAKILLKSTNKFQFVLMGDGSEREKIENMVLENNLREYFLFTGYIKEPMAYMQNLDIFILPSKREDFSLALLEAGSLGLPCLAFDVGGNKEIIVDDETGYIIEPFNTKIFVEKIISLMEDIDKLSNMGIKAKRRIEINYSEDCRKVALENLINTIE